MGDPGGTEGTARETPAPPTCPRCGTTVGASDSFCSHCGAPLPPAEGASKRYQHWRWIILSVLVIVLFVGVRAFAALLRDAAAGRRHDLAASRARISLLSRIPPLVASVDGLRLVAGFDRGMSDDSATLESDLLLLTGTTPAPQTLVERVGAELASVRADVERLIGRGVSLAAPGARFTASAAAFAATLAPRR